jgi:hypothetical protein
MASDPIRCADPAAGEQNLRAESSGFEVMKTIEEIRKAFQQVHGRACGDTRIVYMTIPPDFERDADMIVAAAIDELAELRALTRCRYTVAPYSLGGRCSLREGHTGECK